MDIKKLIEDKNEALLNAKRFKNDIQKYNSFKKYAKSLDSQINALSDIDEESIDEIESSSIENENISQLNPTNKETIRKMKQLLRDENHIDHLQNTHNISYPEVKELKEYMKIFKEHNLKKHYEVNNFISNNDLWDKFKNIRALNDHGVHKDVPGILPKFFYIVCKELNINCDGGGTSLDKSRHY